MDIAEINFWKVLSTSLSQSKITLKYWLRWILVPTRVYWDILLYSLPKCGSSIVYPGTQKKNLKSPKACLKKFIVVSLSFICFIISTALPLSSLLTKSTTNLLFVFPYYHYKLHPAIHFVTSSLSYPLSLQLSMPGLWTPNKRNTFISSYRLNFSLYFSMFLFISLWWPKFPSKLSSSDSWFSFKSSLQAQVV